MILFYWMLNENERFFVKCSFKIDKCNKWTDKKEIVFGCGLKARKWKEILHIDIYEDRSFIYIFTFGLRNILHLGLKLLSFSSNLLLSFSLHSYILNTSKYTRRLIQSSSSTSFCLSVSNSLSLSLSISLSQKHTRTHI